MSAITPELLSKLHKQAPRYTSYPTAPEWGSLSSDIYKEKLQAIPKEAPLSLYFHIPFCKTMCLFCGCSVILNRKTENEERYIHFLKQEIDLVASFLQTHQVTQLHFGGGTPTKLSEPLLEDLFQHIQSHFSIDFSKEVAIEIDPRTVVEDEGKKLRLLRRLGFNRVSFGVQDTSPRVQEAIHRYQSLEMTTKTYHLARELGFKGINFDLIYGLPFQTPKTFEQTVSDILALRPDRIALFSYAKIPWLKPHQKAIKEETLPSTQDKFIIYMLAREAFIKSGYVPIGMDHFSLPEDEMTNSYHNKTLQRNFQGYTQRLAEHMVGFGVTSIGYVNETYIQNIKELDSYYASLNKGELPVHRGKTLSKEDLLRKWVIHTLMCNFELDKQEFLDRFQISFDDYFSSVRSNLMELSNERLIEETPFKITTTEWGKLFIRNIAMIFDAYLKQENSQPKFSQSI